MSKSALLASVKEELRLAEKRLGNDRWALTGAGAKRNPPDAKRKRVLKARITATERLVKELRATRAVLQGERQVRGRIAGMDAADVDQALARDLAAELVSELRSTRTRQHA